MQQALENSTDVEIDKQVPVDQTELAQDAKLIDGDERDDSAVLVDDQVVASTATDDVEHETTTSESSNDAEYTDEYDIDFLYEPSYDLPLLAAIADGRLLKTEMYGGDQKGQGFDDFREDIITIREVCDQNPVTRYPAGSNITFWWLFSLFERAISDRHLLRRTHQRDQGDIRLG